MNKTYRRYFKESYSPVRLKEEMAEFEGKGAVQLLSQLDKAKVTKATFIHKFTKAGVRGAVARVDRRSIDFQSPNGEIIVEFAMISNVQAAYTNRGGQEILETISINLKNGGSVSVLFSGVPVNVDGQN